MLVSNHDASQVVLRVNNLLLIEYFSSKSLNNERLSKVRTSTSYGEDGWPLASSFGRPGKVFEVNVRKNRIALYQIATISQTLKDLDWISLDAAINVSRQACIRIMFAYFLTFVCSKISY